MKAKEYQAILQAAAEILGGAMHVVNADGITIIYNEEMAKLEKISVSDVLGKPFRKAFSFIPEEESTLFQALKNRKSSIRRQQTYLNVFGKEITTVNTTVPIIVDDRVVAAMEVARDITDIKDMSDRLMDLQDTVNAKAAGSGSGKPKGIRKYSFDDLIGESRAFEETVARAKKAARNDVSVLIYGETGVGKELFAQSIHYDGLRRDKPFLAQNCAAIPESLLEGVLFGTVKGGFTGAEDRAGLFEQANGGTLLLDEIGDMSLAAQTKVLRALQESEITRVGSDKAIKVNVRVLAATNKDLQKEIAAGNFREDLFHRLNVIPIHVPSLNERLEDIPLLVDYFADQIGAEQGIALKSFEPEAIKALQDKQWTGNIRQLRNVVERLIILAGAKITKEDVEMYA